MGSFFELNPSNLCINIILMQVLYLIIIAIIMVEFLCLSNFMHFVCIHIRNLINILNAFPSTFLSHFETWQAHFLFLDLGSDRLWNLYLFCHNHFILFPFVMAVWGQFWSRQLQRLPSLLFIYQYWNCRDTWRNSKDLLYKHWYSISYFFE